MKLTTDQVREAFAIMEDEAATQENHVNFDKWLFVELQRVAELAIAKERERIIKLLEDPSNWYEINIALFGSSAGTGYPNNRFALQLIALIKGEEQ